MGTSSFVRRLSLGLSCVLLALGLAITLPPTARAVNNCEEISCNKDQQSEDDYLSCNKQKQQCWEDKIKQTQDAAVTLNNTIGLLNGKIAIQELQIDQTLTEIRKLEREIAELTERISGLNVSLDRLSTVLIRRVQEQYKRRAISPLLGMLTQDTFSKSLLSYRYVTAAQQQTATAMQLAEAQKQTYDEQKALKETKQAEVEQKKLLLEQQQAELTKQRSEQQYLLQETKNNEAKFQRSHRVRYPKQHQ